MSKIKYFICIIILLCILLSSCVYAINDQYIWSEDTIETSSTEFKNVEKNQNNLNLESGGAILIEQNT